MPLFISFEGPDGSGKSTQARHLLAALRLRGYQITLTREPGGTPLGDRIRPLVLDPEAPSATPLAMALLLSASRAQLVSEVIRPALARGEIVVADRFADSTIAYQSAGLGLSIDSVRSLTAIATGGLRPNPVIYIDVPPELGLARVRQRGARDRLDAQDLDFHHRVREGYRRLIRDEPGRWIVLDGTASPEAIQTAIMEAIVPLLVEVTNSV